MAVVKVIEYIYRVTEVIDRVPSEIPRVTIPVSLGLNSLIHLTYRDDVVNHLFRFVVTFYSPNRWWLSKFLTL